MDVSKFEEIQEKIKDSKDQKARAEGSLEEVTARLKEDYGVEDIETAQAKLKELETSIEKDEEKIEIHLEKLEAITDWDAL